MYFLFSCNRFWLIAFISCCTASGAFSQSSAIVDSLLSVVSTAQEPVPRIEAYHELAWIFRKKDPDSAYAFAAKGIEEAKAINDKKRMYVGHVRQAEIERLRRKYEEAIASFRYSLALEQETNHSYGIARAYYGETLCLRQLSRLAEANKSIDQAISALTEEQTLSKEQKELLARSYHQLALIKDEQKEYEAALEAFASKMQIANELGDTRLKATTQSYMASIYRKHGSVDIAASYYIELIGTWDSLGNPDQKARAHTSLAAVYIDENRLEEAKEQTMESKALCEQ